MPFPAPSRFVLGSAGATAILTILSACSQPASFAPIDLSNSGVNQSAQFRPVASLNGPQSFPNGSQFRPTPQLTVGNVPGNQIASLGNTGGGFDTFGILQQQQSAPLQSSPSFRQPNLLTSPQFQRERQSVNRGLGNDFGQQRAPFSGAQSPGGTAPFEPLASVDPVDVDVAPSRRPDTAPRRTALPPRFERNSRQSPVIEEAALEPLAPPQNRRPQERSRDIRAVGDDYATPVGNRFDPRDRDAYRAPNKSQFGRPDTGDQYNRAALELLLEQQRAQLAEQRALLEQKRQRSQRDFRQAPAERPSLQRPRQTAPQRQFDPNLNVPRASGAYPRPYALLRPGVWPELQNPGIGYAQAPNRTPVRQVASLPPPPLPAPQAMARANSERGVRNYQIRRGDTLLTIAQATGTTPEEVALNNGLSPQAEIFIGQVLVVPGPAIQRPVNVSYERASIQIVDADEPQRVNSSRETLTAKLRHAKKAAQPQQSPAPLVRATTSGNPTDFAWPIHGKVYRLEAGQLEIENEGNAPVSASAAGKVVHVERGNMGVLVVIEHDNGWRSLTVGLDYSEVRPGSRVKQGQMIGKSSRDHRVRYELRDADAGVADALKQLRG